MKAFISYSHINKDTLERLHVHLAQLKREELITAWTDEEILAGGSLDKHISKNLNDADIFIALLSPDYIASNYCYEKEFAKALEMVEQEKIIIVPIIVEPCEWTKTPFKKFKALPTDGKPIVDFQNTNTAFLNIIQELRKLIEGNYRTTPEHSVSTVVTPTRNYKVKKDFDTIQKLEFKEKSFLEIKKLLKAYLAEVELLDNIKKRIIIETETNFEAILVNRNKVNTECKLRVTIEDGKQFSNNYFSRNADLAFSFDDNWAHNNSLEIGNDDFEMYWLLNTANNFQHGAVFQSTAKDISDYIWEAWLEKVGIV